MLSCNYCAVVHKLGTLSSCLKVQSSVFDIKWSSTVCLGLVLKSVFLPATDLEMSRKTRHFNGQN
jgi:hypothetical protein